MIQKIIIALTFLLMLNGCVHKMDIEQGNVISAEKIRQIHLGMTKDQVIEILGEPVLTDPTNSNQLDYVYTSKPGQGKIIEKTFILLFDHNRLQKINGSMN